MSVLLLTTPPNMPVMDTGSYLKWIERGDRWGIANTSGALTGVTMYALTRLWPGDNLGTITAVNAMAVATVALMLWHFIGGFAGFIAGLMWTFSWGTWHLIAGEYIYLAPIVLLAIFWALARRPDRPAWQFVGLGALNGLAMMLRQESALFVLVAGTLIGSRVVSLSRVVRDYMLYFIGMVLAGWALIFALGVFFIGLSVPDTFDWYTTVRAGAGVQEYTEYPGYLPFDPLRAIKAQGAALTIGADMLADAIKTPDILAAAWWIPVMVALTLVAFVLIGAAVVRALRDWREPEVLACLMWLSVYTFAMRAWFWPSHPKYAVVTLIPLLILVGRGWRRPA